jgi:hypothetical protein
MQQRFYTPVEMKRKNTKPDFTKRAAPIQFRDWFAVPEKFRKATFHRPRPALTDFGY